MNVSVGGAMKNRYDSEQTVNDIVRVSTQLFTEKGYDKTSIQDIVNGLDGLTRGAVYHHFDSKEDILIAVIQTLVPQSNYIENMIEDNTSSGREKIKTVITKMLMGAKASSQLPGLKLIEKNPKILVEIFNLGNDYVVPQLEKLIIEGNNDGSLSIAYPYSVAEASFMLFDTWFSSIMYKDTLSQFDAKLHVLKMALDGMGLDVLDSECMEMILKTEVIK